MDTNDQVAQQQADNLRRLQQADNQRRLEEQQRLEHVARELRQRELDDEELDEATLAERRRRQLRSKQQELEDEEREEHQRAHDGEQAEQDRLARPRRSMLWPLSARANANELDKHSLDEDDEPSAATAPSSIRTASSAGSGGGIAVWVIGLVVVVALGIWTAPKWFKSSWLSGNSKKEAIHQPAIAPALPLAPAADSASVTRPTPTPVPDELALGAAPAQPAAPTSADAASATPAADRPHVQSTAHDSLPPLPALASASASAAVAHPDPVLASAQRPGDGDASGTRLPAAPAVVQAQSQSEIAALRARVNELEARLAERGLQSPTAPVATRRVNTPKRARAPISPAAASSVPDTTKRRATGAIPQLLAIDMWDGRPSVVIGTSAAGDQRVRILQPGESLNGIGLESVDAAAGRATFTVGAGQRVTLEVGEGAKP